MNQGPRDRGVGGFTFFTDSKIRQPVQTLKSSVAGEVMGFSGVGKPCFWIRQLALIDMIICKRPEKVEMYCDVSCYYAIEVFNDAFGSGSFSNELWTCYDPLHLMIHALHWSTAPYFFQSPSLLKYSKDSVKTLVVFLHTGRLLFLVLI